MLQHEPVAPVASLLAPVAVVVASRDRPAMVDRCLASVRAALGPRDELVLVDSASAAEHRPAYEEAARRHGAVLVRADRPGVNRARNAGWRATSAAVVLFTDDDVEVEPGWAAGFAAALHAHPDAAFLTGWIAAPEGETSGHDVAVLSDERARVLDRSTRGLLGHGASLAVRRSALEQVGGWDEALGAGARFRAAPEVDLFDRLLHAGLVGRYEPAARARHHQWRTERELAALHFRYGLGTGARLAKLARYDRQRLRHAAREAWWEWGVRDVLHALRDRHERRALVALLRMAGFVAGFVEALGTPVRDGHYR